MAGAAAVPTMLERHYKVPELAEMWSLDADTVREWFADEPGVLKVGRLGKASGRAAAKRHNISMRIPESVALRVYSRRCA